MLFRNKYAFLSNMYPCDLKVDIEGKTYTFKCVESAFHAFKCPTRLEEFTNLDGVSAKKLGRQVELRKDWEDIKLDVMTKLLEIKFSDPTLMAKLKEVKGEIVETNFWRDTYWGKYYGKGENHLGKILMDIRDNN